MTAVVVGYAVIGALIGLRAARLYLAPDPLRTSPRTPAQRDAAVFDATCLGMLVALTWPLVLVFVAVDAWHGRRRG